MHISKKTQTLNLNLKSIANDTGKPFLTHMTQKTFYLLTNSMLSESKTESCFFFLISLTTDPSTFSLSQTDIAGLNLIFSEIAEILTETITDLAFFCLGVEKAGDVAYKINIFLAIQNLVGSNKCIAQNIKAPFLEREFNSIEIVECTTLTQKSLSFQLVVGAGSNPVIKPIIVLYPPFQFVFNPLETFTKSNNLGVLFETKPSLEFRPEFLRVEENNLTRGDITYQNLVHLFRIFFEHQGWAVFDRKIYKFNKDSDYSVSLLKRVDNISRLFTEATLFVQEYHWTTFNNFDFLTLKTKFLQTFTEKFKQQPEASVPSIELVSDIIEFKDGLYLVGENLFVSKNFTSVAMEEKKLFVYAFLRKRRIKTLVSHRRAFRSLRPPKTWLTLFSESKKTPATFFDEFLTTHEENCVQKMDSLAQVISSRTVESNDKTLLKVLSLVAEDGFFFNTIAKFAFEKGQKSVSEEEYVTHLGIKLQKEFYSMLVLWNKQEHLCKKRKTISALSKALRTP